MKFLKYHALGNDYLVLDPEEAPELPATDDTIASAIVILVSVPTASSMVPYQQNAQTSGYALSIQMAPKQKKAATVCASLPATYTTLVKFKTKRSPSIHWVVS